MGLRRYRSSDITSRMVQAVHLAFHAAISTITLNRPSQHNAFDAQMLTEFDAALQTVEQDPATRVLILKANGSNFCAGADLNWMLTAATLPLAANKADATRFAAILGRLAHLPKPTIALAQGQVIGGGCGLMACCDVVVASQDAAFCFTEVKLGLVPATIAPYVVRRIGYQNAKRYFLTAERFSAETAERMQLIDAISDTNALSARGLALADQILSHEPEALKQVKMLLNTIAPIDPSLHDYTAQMLAERRSAPEAQARMSAVLKRT